MVRIKITKNQKKLVEAIHGKGDFYEVDDILYFKPKEKETTFRVDFDESVYKSVDGEEHDSKDTTDSKIKKQKSETKMEKTEALTEDLTAQQNEENYWHTTVETKLDGSSVMMETRISKLMEATGMSREKASIEVKKRMKKAGSENTNTEDMTEDAQKKKKGDAEVYDGDDKEEGEEVIAKKKEKKEKEEKKDTLEAKERLDFLEAFFKENKEKEDSQATRLDALESSLKKYQEQESAKLDTQLEEHILKLATDFLIPEEEVVKKLEGKKGKEGLKYVQDLEDILTLSRPKDDKQEGIADTTDYLAQAEAQALKVRNELRHI